MRHVAVVGRDVVLGDLAAELLVELGVVVAGGHHVAAHQHRAAEGDRSVEEVLVLAEGRQHVRVHAGQFGMLGQSSVLLAIVSRIMGLGMRF